METPITESLIKGSEYFNVGYSLGALIGVLFMIISLGFASLLLFSTFYRRKYS
tara:strand:+ start:215 stop:373 length:159 start_codon:yes stop_codon:yes gene_type:complete